MKQQAPTRHVMHRARGCAPGRLRVALVLLTAVCGVAAPQSAVRPAGAGAFHAPRLSPAAAGAATVTPRPGVRAASRHRQLSFELNRGQTDARVQFLARGEGYTVFLTPTETVLVLHQPVPPDRGVIRTADAAPGHPGRTDPGPLEPAGVRMRLVGANPTPPVRGVTALPGKIHYFKGSDPQQWVTNVTTYAKVQYDEVYPGVDLIYYGNQHRLEYDFLVAPGANPHAIAWVFEGADHVEIDGHGALVVQSAGGQMVWPRPAAYQGVNGNRRDVASAYVLTADSDHPPSRTARRRVSLQLGPYDPSRPLVIDPLLIYSTYLGGNSDDSSTGVAVDAQGNSYVTGTTLSTHFPTTPGAHQRRLRGETDVFVTKFDASGALVYSTYLGDRCADAGGGIAVDAAGHAYVTGRANGDCSEGLRPGVFVAKFNPAGRLAPGGYFFLFGGRYDADSRGQAIAVDAQGRAYVAGVTLESDFPTTPKAFRRDPCSGKDGFVAKVNAAGNRLVYSTYLCGNGDDSPNGIAVDPDGHAYVAGHTVSSDFPTRPFQLPPPGMFTHNGFVTKLTPNGRALVYSTYLGGSSDDEVTGIAVHAASHHAYVTGWTRSHDFPTTPGVVQPKNPEVCAGFGFSCFEAFVTRFNATGACVYSTYLYGEDGDQGNGIAVDADGNAYVTGVTTSRYFPIVNAFQPHGGAPLSTPDAFVTKLNATGSALVYSSYLGGSQSGEPDLFEGEEMGLGIAVDTGGNTVVVGITRSFNFPTLEAWQPHLDGGRCGYSEYLCTDAFVTKIAAKGPGKVPAVRLRMRPKSVPLGGTLTATWAGITFPTASDTLQLNPLGSADVDARASWPTTGAASDRVAVALPGTAEPGWYELRLLSPDPDDYNSMKVIARSAPFEVVTSTLPTGPN